MGALAYQRQSEAFYLLVGTGLTKILAFIPTGVAATSPRDPSRNSKVEVMNFMGGNFVVLKSAPRSAF